MKTNQKNMSNCLKNNLLLKFIVLVYLLSVYITYNNKTKIINLKNIVL